MLGCLFPFVSGGRQVAQCRMQTDIVVEADDVVGDVPAGLGVVKPSREIPRLCRGECGHPI